LKELGVTPSLGFPAPPKVPENVPTPESLKLARMLSDVGLFRDALEEVNLQAGLIRGNGDDALKFAQYLQKLGEFGPAYAIGARQFWGVAFGQKDPSALALLYPRAYASAVEEAAKLHGVDPFYIWAIMRRESAFRPEVVSSADARGLMQLIPPTAAGIGAAIKKPLESPDMLYAPSVNVYYATWYLGALWKRFNHPTLVAAAYNGGPNPTVKWAQDRGELDLDLFVETIPYKETRGYVKQVVADYFLYHAFYGDPTKQPTLQMKVPQPAKEGVNF
jgi:soluble lytic murein transglycosylase